MNSLLLTDYYKTEHHRMYNPGTTLIYSNLTPRKSRMKGVTKVVVFGIQYFVLKYLVEHFNDNFFKKDIEEIIEEYQFAVNVDVTHIRELHKLGYLPIELKSLPEGTKCPIGVPCLTIKNTHPKFFWIVNYLETLLSLTVWQPMTSATIALEYKKILTKYALETTGSSDFVAYQGHDFSMRGMGGLDAALSSGMAHLTSFLGTDVVPAIYELKKYYGADVPAGGSVPATEHSIMCLGEKESEIETFKRLLDLYPSGILSVVSDTWDLWKVCTEYLPALKEQILKRDGKLVIRPDSGDPVDIICGLNYTELDDSIDRGPTSVTYLPYDDRFQHSDYYTGEQGSGGADYFKFKGEYYRYRGEDTIDKCEKIKNFNEASIKGVIELLWDIFGGTVNEQGYRVLDSHIGAIYGDSITLERADEICRRLKAKGYASTNIVFGIGSYTYQYNTRDTFGFAVKATYGEVKVCGNMEDCECEHHCRRKPIQSREIFKDPITDDGTKKSKKGLLCVCRKSDTRELVVKDQQSWAFENVGELKTVFKDGKLVKETNLDEIRNRLKV